MDKIFSTRMDEAVIQRIRMLAAAKHTSQKAIIEAAIDHYAKETANLADVDIFSKTSGAWRRDESPRQTVARGRQPFRESMTRHQK